MSSVMTASYCATCHAYIYPGAKVPPSHLRHSAGSAVVGQYCNTCHSTFYGNQELSDNHPHVRHMQRDKEAIKQDSLNSMVNAEKEPQYAKIREKKFVKVGGIIPNEDIVVDELLAKEFAKRRNNK